MPILTVMDCPQCEGEGAVGGVECPACAGTGEAEQLTPTRGDAIQAAASPAVANALALPEDPVSKALAEVTAKTTTILQLADKGRELAARFKNVAFNVSTTKGLDEAKAARLALREEVRYPMQRLKDDRSKMLGTMQRQANASADELIAEVLEYERPIHEQIEAEETRKETARREREEAEQRRRQRHMETIAAVAAIITAAAGEDSAQLVKIIESTQGIVIDESYEEYQGQAQQAKDETLRQLNGMLVAARAEEAELEETRRQQAQLAAAQLQLEADRRAQTEQARALAEREEKLAEKERQQQAEAESLARAKQERAEAVQRRIDSFAEPARRVREDATRTAADIRKTIRHVEATVLTVELLDDRVAEAQRAKDAAIADLTSIAEEREAKEAEEARQAHAARIQDLIDNIRGMGESATLAVQDGSADVVQLRVGRDELVADLVTTEVFGERVYEASEVQRLALDAINDAIRATEERDRLRAEEEERQQQQRQEQMAAIALADAKRSHGEDLYEMLRRIVTEYEEECLPLGIEARELLVKINPAEDFED